jgi:hypothetical protein
VHVLGASHGGRLYHEQLGSHLRFFAKHYGVREAERMRLLLRASLVLRGALFRGERGARYREAARWIASARVPALLDRTR